MGEGVMVLPTFTTMKIKHEDLLFLGKNYASATFSSPDWPTTAVVVFRDLSDDGKINFALESVNGPWHNNSDFAKDYDHICGLKTPMTTGTVASGSIDFSCQVLSNALASVEYG
jgi:hypothetical protein